MPWRWVRRVNSYITESSWPAVRFQPILYFFLFGAALRLWREPSAPLNFDQVITPGFYEVWLGIGVGAPILSLLAWWLIHKRSGRARYVGMWTRTSADLLVFVYLLSFHIVSALHSVNPSESKIFTRYILGAAITFVITLIGRDVWALMITERIAWRIRRGR